MGSTYPHIDAVASKLSCGICVEWLPKYFPTQLLTTDYGLFYLQLGYGLILWGACAYNISPFKKLSYF